MNRVVIGTLTIGLFRAKIKAKSWSDGFTEVQHEKISNYVEENFSHEEFRKAHGGLIMLN